ncbi:N-acetylglucosamine-6-phosphate deacetylase [Phytoactinopolyspora limicola]|uniref:N-acetylglucosamine-6-phosphate deacetylase n=1 Tax=Phytoactinopolyspora limicola TaxID=2715536 RepID=UPI001407C24E|nr:amidohydrolase family protein [Phytoactinopolyspora limicola]
MPRRRRHTSVADSPDELVLTGGLIVTPAEVRSGVAVHVRDGRIADLVPYPAPPGDSAPWSDAATVVDVGGRLVTPGLVDLHVHGGFGYSFDHLDDESALVAMLRGFARSGVTSVQASLVSAGLPELLHRIDRIGAAAGPADGAELLGVHLEGPFLAAGQCGAHDPAVLRAPTDADVAALVQRRDVVGMITLAPELPGARAAVTQLATAGIVVAAGHSEATVDELAGAVADGLSHVTHLWSGQTGLTRRGPWRVPGLLEASLASTGLTAEVIADGRHLPAELLEIARRCLGERLIVVSDGTPGTGMPAGFRYRLGTVECEVADGVGVVVGADAFGGSTSLLPRMLTHLHDDLEWPLPEVVAMATSRPAAIAGVADRKGAVAVGMDADLAVFDPGFVPWGVVVGGRWIPSSATT